MGLRTIVFAGSAAIAASSIATMPAACAPADEPVPTTIPEGPSCFGGVSNDTKPRYAWGACYVNTLPYCIEYTMKFVVNGVTYIGDTWANNGSSVVGFSPGGEISSAAITFRSQPGCV